MFPSKSKFASDRIILGCSAALVFLWPVANVMAARKLLLVILLFWLTYDFVRNANLRKLVNVGMVAPIALGLLVVWMLLVSFFVDLYPERSLRELKGEWLPAIASFWVGAILVARIRSGNGYTRMVLRPLYFALIAVVATQFGIAIWHWTTAGALPAWFGGISDHKMTITYVSTIAASLLLADAVTLDQASKPLNLHRVASLGSFALILITTYISGTRNGIIVLLLLMSIGAFVWLYRTGKQRRVVFWGTLLVSFVLAFAAIWAMLKVDPRWERFVATVPIAWNIDATDAWVNAYDRGLPIAGDGLPVEQTAFERIAWARAAARFLVENPLGVGVTRHAFRELMQAKYGNVAPAHSHNGYLDFALAVGVPGLLLWLTFLGVLVMRSVVAGLGVGSGSNLALLLLVVGFSVRGCLDSTLRDHILEQFMFFAGVLLAVSGGYNDAWTVPEVGQSSADSRMAKSRIGTR